MASFSTYEECQDHAIIDNCELQLEKKTKVEAVDLYVDKLKKSHLNSNQIEIASNATSTVSISTVEMGWALKEGRKNARFNDRQKEFLIQKFNNGLLSGHKEDPENVSESMKFSTNPDGSRMFKMDEFLTPQQIMSFFSRHARKSDAAREQVITDLQQTLQ